MLRMHGLYMISEALVWQDYFCASKAIIIRGNDSSVIEIIYWQYIFFNLNKYLKKTIKKLFKMILVDNCIWVKYSYLTHMKKNLKIL